MSIVYKHTNKVNGKSYVGKTVKSLTERWKQHIKESKSPKTAFHRAIAKYGVDCWISEILILDSVNLNDDERNMISSHRTLTTQHGYNMTNGGDGGSGYGEENSFYGKKHSTETKQKISQSKLGVSVNAGSSNPSFKGFYITPWGKYDSRRKAANDAPIKMSVRSIQSLCTRSHKPISKVQEVKSTYLQSIDHKYATPKELGFDFIPCD